MSMEGALLEGLASGAKQLGALVAPKTTTALLADDATLGSVISAMAGGDSPSRPKGPAPSAPPVQVSAIQLPMAQMYDQPYVRTGQAEQQFRQRRGFSL